MAMSRRADLDEIFVGWTTVEKVHDQPAVRKCNNSRLACLGCPSVNLLQVFLSEAFYYE